MDAFLLPDDLPSTQARQDGVTAGGHTHVQPNLQDLCTGAGGATLGYSKTICEEMEGQKNRHLVQFRGMTERTLFWVVVHRQQAKAIKHLWHWFILSFLWSGVSPVTRAVAYIREGQAWRFEVFL